jgi:hypothetical protein
MVTIIKRMTKDGWFCDLSNGKSFDQDDAPGAISAWYRLKALCDNENLQIVQFGLRLGEVTLTIEEPNSALGFWQAQQMAVSDDVNSNNPDWHWRGIGFVGTNYLVECTWLAYPHTPFKENENVSGVRDSTGKFIAITKTEHRPAIVEKQVIWKPGVIPRIPTH